MYTPATNKTLATTPVKANISPGCPGKKYVATTPAIRENKDQRLSSNQPGFRFRTKATIPTAKTITLLTALADDSQLHPDIQVVIHGKNLSRTLLRSKDDKSNAQGD